MLIRFWGTRGSVATPGPHTVRYGGNTSCVEVRSGEALAILDCGTGIRGLGMQLATSPDPIKAHLLLTHIHWDHIQGFPFFSPIFLPQASIDVYGAAGLEQGLEEALNGQMQYTYFPVELGELPARFGFHELGETQFSIEGMSVQTQFLNHTCPTLGYRLTSGGASMAYITDHEPFVPYNPDLPIEESFVHPGGRRHLAFAEGLDVLVHDAQYTTEEYPAKRGWGHSTIDYVVDLAVAANVGKLALFHHDPSRDDDTLARLVERAQERALRRGGKTEVIAAAEGLTIDLAEVRTTEQVQTPAAIRVPRPTPRVVILGNRQQRRALRWALVEDGYFLSEAGLEDDLARAPGGVPDAVLVAPPADAEAVPVVQRVVTAAQGAPVVVLLDRPVDPSLLARLGEMAEDVLSAPYTLPNLRARVRASIGRQTGTDTAARGAPMIKHDTLQALDRLNPEGLEDFLQLGTFCEFRPGDILFTEGDPPGGVYYLHTGRVLITLHGADGQEVSIGYSGPGDTIGEMSALDGGPRSATGRALEPVKATYVTSEAFRRALEQSPGTAVRLLRLLVRRLREVDGRLSGADAMPVAGLASLTESPSLPESLAFAEPSQHFASSKA